MKSYLSADKRNGLKKISDQINQMAGTLSHQLRKIREREHRVTSEQCHDHPHPDMNVVIRKRLKQVYDRRRRFAGSVFENLHIRQRTGLAHDVIQAAFRGGIGNFSPDIFRVKYETQLLDT